MKIFRPFIVSIAVLPFLLSSCADEKSVDADTIQKNLLEAYMVVNYDKNNIPRPAQADMGYYYIPLRSTGSSTAPVDERWIRYDISSRMPDGTLLFTSSKDIAKQDNSFSDLTHYTPDYFIMGEDYGYISRGIADAMKNYTKVGDSIRIIMYPNIVSSRYLPTTSSTGGPIILDIGIKDVVLSPDAKEAEDLLSYKNTSYPAAAPLKGKSGADTTGIYFQELIPQPVADDIVVEDSDTVWVQYTGKYLDGYMFDTNIADSAKKYNRYSYDPSKYAASGLRIIISNSNSDEDGQVVKGFEAAIRNMKVGSTAVVMFTSPWGYGAMGNSDSDPKYASMMFYIRLLDVGKGSNNSATP